MKGHKLVGLNGTALNSSEQIIVKTTASQEAKIPTNSSMTIATNISNPNNSTIVNNSYQNTSTTDGNNSLTTINTSTLHTRRPHIETTTRLTVIESCLQHDSLIDTDLLKQSMLMTVDSYPAVNNSQTTVE